MIDAMKTAFSSVNVMSIGYVMPTGVPGQQSVLQQVVVYSGDAKKLAAAQKQSVQTMNDFMKLLPQAPGASVKFEVKPDAKTVDGASLDQFTMQFTFDRNEPGGAQAAQMMTMLYGPGGLSGYMGVLDDKTYIQVTGGDDELLNTTVAAAKAKASPLADLATVKAVAAQLPANRGAVAYIAVDNIIATVCQYAAQFGVPIQLKLPPDLPPLGVAVGTEGPAIRVDMAVPSELIENLVAAAIQMGMQRGGAPPRPGAL
jgi:hypothetical protein